MARRQSAMQAKVFMANLREWKKLNKLPPLPLLMSEPTKSSRGIEPKPRELSRGEKVRLELSRRSRLSPAQRADRDNLITLAAIRKS